MIASIAIGLTLLHQSSVPAIAKSIFDKGMTELRAYEFLAELTTKVGGRPAGSPAAEKAVRWGFQTMKELGLEKVRLVPCKVRHWVRGRPEKLTMTTPNGNVALKCFALGNSVATPKGGLAGEVQEVKSIEEALQLGERAKGKILFFNGPFDATLTNTFQAYGGAVGQRFAGASTAAKVGAIGALVRSMTLDPDDEPHTGAMGYQPGLPKVPAAAVSIIAANKLSEAIHQPGGATVRLEMSCQTLPDAPSANVIGEITGTEKPNEVVVVGGHLDSWDLGRGAHDDGTGVTGSLEALRLIHDLGLRPKRTICVVLFMNEENGGEGAEAYAKFTESSGEKAYAAIESDSGGFAPRGIGTSLNDATGLNKSWLGDLRQCEINAFTAEGETGADVEKLARFGTFLFGLEPESQRYFDYHHSRKDTLDKVNRRELELGATSLAILSWHLANDELP